jgi:hypothetical protein
VRRGRQGYDVVTSARTHLEKHSGGGQEPRWFSPNSRLGLGVHGALAVKNFGLGLTGQSFILTWNSDVLEHVLIAKAIHSPPVLAAPGEIQPIGLAPAAARVWDQASSTRRHGRAP